MLLGAHCLMTALSIFCSIHLDLPSVHFKEQLKGLRLNSAAVLGPKGVARNQRGHTQSVVLLASEIVVMAAFSSQLCFLRGRKFCTNFRLAAKSRLLMWRTSSQCLKRKTFPGTRVLRNRYHLQFGEIYRSERKPRGKNDVAAAWRDCLMTLHMRCAGGVGTAKTVYFGARSTLVFSLRT